MHCEDIRHYITIRTTGKILVKPSFIDYLTGGDSSLGSMRLPVVLEQKLAEKFGQKVLTRTMWADIPAEWLPTICHHFDTAKLDDILDIAKLTYPDHHLDDATARVLESILKGHIGGELDEYLTQLIKSLEPNAPDPDLDKIVADIHESFKNDKIRPWNLSGIFEGTPTPPVSTVREVTLTVNDSLKDRALKARENGKTNLSRVHIDIAGNILPMTLKQILFLISTDKDNREYTCGLTPSETDTLASVIDTHILMLTGNLPKRNLDDETVYPLEAFFIISHFYKLYIDRLGFR